jgi:hypothetical protein
MTPTTRRCTYLLPLSVGAIEDHMGGRCDLALDDLAGPAEPDPTLALLAPRVREA